MQSLPATPCKKPCVPRPIRKNGQKIGRLAILSIGTPTAKAMREKRGRNADCKKMKGANMRLLNRCKVGLIAIGTAGITGLAAGQEATNSVIEKNDPPADADRPLFHAQEFSIDGFASGTLSEQYLDHFNHHTLRHDARFGAGAGVNYFFTRYFGIGADAFSESVTHGELIDNASGNLIARLPIAIGNLGLAPYVFGGAGHQFDLVQQTFGQAGAGLEFRLMRHMGLFVDARAVLPDKTKTYGEARAGLRISF